MPLLFLLPLFVIREGSASSLDRESEGEAEERERETALAGCCQVAADGR